MAIDPKHKRDALMVMYAKISRAVDERRAMGEFDTNSAAILLALEACLFILREDVEGPQ